MSSDSYTIIYRRYPTIQSIIHSHFLAILPFSVTGIFLIFAHIVFASLFVWYLKLSPGVDLRPCVHMSGFPGMVSTKPRAYCGDITNKLYI